MWLNSSQLQFSFKCLEIKEKKVEGAAKARRVLELLVAPPRQVFLDSLFSDVCSSLLAIPFFLVMHKSFLFDSGMEETGELGNGVELTTSVSDKHFDLLRRYSIFRATDGVEHEKGKYSLIRDPEDLEIGIYDKPLPCYGCGIGWFSFLFGFLCPPMWYYATMLYFGNFYRKDPRERAGLGASAFAALLCSVALLIIGAMLLLRSL
ncbi:hypothetical protein VNO77_23114 [Canavalia gladiata]|uniref:Ribosomal protein L18a n=1 Tax=Canavalia gladiata TaxID=3824 RepID=A0AAN9L7A7_CANGL